MSTFESSIKQIPYPQSAVYRNLSDLSNLERVRDRVPEDKVKDFTFDRDSVTISVDPVGQITLRICEREVIPSVRSPSASVSVRNPSASSSRPPSLPSPSTSGFRYCPSPTPPAR